MLGNFFKSYPPGGLYACLDMEFYENRCLHTEKSYVNKAIRNCVLRKFRGVCLELARTDPEQEEDWCRLTMSKCQLEPAVLELLLNQLHCYSDKRGAFNKWFAIWLTGITRSVALVVPGQDSESWQPSLVLKKGRVILLKNAPPQRARVPDKNRVKATAAQFGKEP